MSFFVASSISPVFPFPAFPVGILGMGFALSSNLVNPQKNFFGTLGLEVIGLFLGESGPELIVGGTDSSKFSGNLTIIESDTVSILRRVPWHCLTRTRYRRISGRSIWILSQSTELMFH
jgi:hypothetical protein